MALEPIDDKDLDLEAKFAGKIQPEAEPGKMENNPPAPENPVIAESPRREGAIEKEKAYSKILSKVRTSAEPDNAAVPLDAQKTSEVASAEAKIEMLVKLAMAKGVVHAVKVARHLEDNYTLDEFHDRLLAQDLHAALTQKGLIKEI